MPDNNRLTYGFNRQDAADLVQLIGSARGNDPRRGQPIKRHAQVQIFETPVAGIPAKSGATLGSATCTYVDINGTVRTLSSDEDVVYNNFFAAIAGGVDIIAGRQVGQWVVMSEDCEDDGGVVSSPTLLEYTATDPLYNSGTNLEEFLFVDTSSNEIITLLDPSLTADIFIKLVDATNKLTLDPNPDGLTFDGTNDDIVVTAGTHTLSGVTMTIKATFTATSNGNDLALVSKGGASNGGYELFIRNSDGALQFTTKQTGSASDYINTVWTTDVLDSAEHSIVLSVDYTGSGTTSLTIDGSTDTKSVETVAAGTYGDDTVNTVIGSQNDGSTHFYNGSIARVELHRSSVLQMAGAGRTNWGTLRGPVLGSTETVDGSNTLELIAANDSVRMVYSQVNSAWYIV